jgi:hypothetical protein
VAILIVVIALVLIGIMFAANRANTLFVIQVKEGRCQVLRGHVPGGLLSRIREVVRLGRLQDVRIIAVRGRDRVEIRVHPADESTQQRLRNVMGTHPTSAFRANAESPWVGRLRWTLGVTAMSWLFSRFMR